MDDLPTSEKWQRFVSIPAAHTWQENETKPFHQPTNQEEDQKLQASGCHPAAGFLVRILEKRAATPRALRHKNTRQHRNDRTQNGPTRKLASIRRGAGGPRRARGRVNEPLT